MKQQVRNSDPGIFNYRPLVKGLNLWILERIWPGVRNVKKQVYEDIKLELTGDMKYLETSMLDVSYNFMMMLPHHTYSDMDMLESKGFG